MLEKDRKVPSHTKLLHNITDVNCLQISKFYGQNGSIVAFSLQSKKVKFINTCLPVSRYSTVGHMVHTAGDGGQLRGIELIGASGQWGPSTHAGQGSSQSSSRSSSLRRASWRRSHC